MEVVTEGILSEGAIADDDKLRARQRCNRNQRSSNEVTTRNRTLSVEGELRVLPGATRRVGREKSKCPNAAGGTRVEKGGGRHNGFVSKVNEVPKDQ